VAAELMGITGEDEIDWWSDEDNTAIVETTEL